MGDDISDDAERVMRYIREREEHITRCVLARKGKLKITSGMMASIKRPHWRRELIEAICIGQIK